MPDACSMHGSRMRRKKAEDGGKSEAKSSESKSDGDAVVKKRRLCNRPFKFILWQYLEKADGRSIYQFSRGKPKRRIYL